MKVRFPGGPQRRVARSQFAIAALSLILVTYLIRNSSTSPESSSPSAASDEEEQDQGWAGSFLHRKADFQLNELVDERSKTHKYTACDGDKLQFKGATVPQDGNSLSSQLDSGSSMMENGEQRIVEVVATTVPCGTSDTGCCKHSFVMRPNTTDFKVYDQIFRQHYMRFLYSVFDSNPSPKYILDAGANAGFSTALFKLMWPDAVIVSVEPDPRNFEVLQRNSASFKGVHPINAGLWGRKARIGLAGQHGEWGKVFKEQRWWQFGGTQAYGVSDLAALFNIPAFDFVKIDIEGAEGQVFAPGADVSWINKANVISLEVHDYFAGYFGLKDVSSRINNVFKDKPFTIVSDNEHIMYVTSEVQKKLQG